MTPEIIDQKQSNAAWKDFFKFEKEYFGKIENMYNEYMVYCVKRKKRHISKTRINEYLWSKSKLKQ